MRLAQVARISRGLGRISSPIIIIFWITRSNQILHGFGDSTHAPEQKHLAPVHGPTECSVLTQRLIVKDALVWGEKHPVGGHIRSPLLLCHGITHGASDRRPYHGSPKAMMVMNSISNPCRGCSVSTWLSKQGTVTRSHPTIF